MEISRRSSVCVQTKTFIVIRLIVMKETGDRDSTGPNFEFQD